MLSFYRKGKRKKSEQEANMEIQVNGKKMELEQAVTLEELVTILKHDKRQIAAEVNLEIIEKDKYTEVMLKEGDVVEIVSFMGGGSL